MVDSVLKGSPAAKAGVKANDKLLKIDDKSVAGMSLTRIAHLLRGNMNSTVHVMVDRGGEKKSFEIQRQILFMPGTQHPSGM